MEKSAELRQLQEALGTETNPLAFGQADMYWRRSRRTAELRDEHKKSVAQYNIRAIQAIEELRAAANRIQYVQYITPPAF